MKPVDFIFSVVTRFAPMGTNDKREILQDAKEWEKGIYIKKEEEKNQLEKYYTKYGDNWFVRLSLGALYIYAVKTIAEYMNDSGDEDDDIDLNDL